MKQRTLFLVPYPTEGASVRLRVEQFLPSLKEAGIEYSLRPFFTPSFYRILYKKGNTFKKVIFFIFCACRRFLDIAKAPFYDTIFIHREVFPLGPPILESILFLFRKRVIFDFDDAIYLPSQGSGKVMGTLKCPWKTDFIIKHSDLVIAGNEFLRDHAKLLNKNVVTIPTCIDTDAYNGPSANKGPKDGIVIGWIGSHTTQIFLKELEPVFVSLLDRHKNLKIYFVGGRLEPVRHERIIEKSWSLKTEKDDVEFFDIGIMPMPDTNWTRGKCGFKAILYMACGIPVVVSPVGVNREIIDDGINGFLAKTGEEWMRRLSMLIEDPALRTAMGKKGREKVVNKYSLASTAPLFYESLKNCKE